MNPSTDDKGGIGSKIEDNNNNNNNNNNENDRLSKALARAASSSSATTTSRQWAGFKNPRIVRVSRTFGGKDRHSKVCTVRGLRDRRIRLSVPTAIQLYDLQDRLGLSQPSKVIDWLLDATKLDIDKLPPLQIPQGNFIDFHQQALFGHLANSSSSLVSEAHQFTPYLDANLTLMKEGPAIDNKEGININDDVDLDEDEDEEDQEDQSINPNLETMTKWNRKTSSDDQNGASASAQSFFPMPGSNGFVPGLMNGAGLMAPYGNMYHWDPSNLSLSQFGSHGSTSSVAPSHHQVEDPQLSNNNYSSTHQLFFCPPLATTPTLFPQHDNRFHHLSNSYGSVMRDFGPHGQMHPGANNAGQQQDKDDK